MKSRPATSIFYAFLNMNLGGGMTTLLQNLRYRLRLPAQAWYRSPEYALAFEFRNEALSRNRILAEGYIPPNLT